MSLKKDRLPDVHFGFSEKASTMNEALTPPLLIENAREASLLFELDIVGNMRQCCIALYSPLQYEY